MQKQMTRGVTCKRRHCFIFPTIITHTNSRTPATKRDSTQYRDGFKMGLAGKKPSKMQLKYEGENEYKKMGRWEGQNKKKKN